MTNLQLYIAVGLPIIAVLASLTVSLFQISGIREDMRGLRADVRADVNDVRAEVRADINDVRAEIRGLRGDVNSQMAALRDDIKLLTGKVIELMDKR